MSTTVAVGGIEVSSNHESAAEMTEALAPPKDDDGQPRVLVDKGKAVETEPEKEGLSKAAAELGKAGGAAAAKARKESEKSDGAETETPEQKAAADEQAAKAKDKKGDPRHDPQARVAQATREAAEAKRTLREADERHASELREIRHEIAEMRANRPPAKTRAADERAEAIAASGEVLTKPKAEDFEQYEEYLDARDQYNRQQWTAETTRQQRAHQQASQHYASLRSAIDGFTGAVTKAIEADADFRTKVSQDVMGLEPSFALAQGQQPNGSNWIADEFVSSPGSAPALMLHLSEHPEDFQRIAALSSPRAVTRELAKIEAAQGAATAGNSSGPAVSQAKPPVRPVTGSPHTAEPDVYGEMDFDTFLSRRRAKRA